ncbi:MAG: sporulation protein [Burkholderiales bacterium 66-5]|uniref:SPOR domain-containing protein n=1 Tax=Comamonas badia TaxID=265291 RepID=UPI000425C20C|nr:SPOR domain-containing protein [Comamonas badia]OJU92263.1 MAG: sporulation protein [Burkholderiales bacterium 66-5]
MLRLAIALLLLANAGYYGWSTGLLAPWGWAPQQEGEPERLQQQIAPQSLQLLGPDTPGSPAAPAPAPAPTPAPPAASPAVPAPADGTAAAPAPEATQCLQAGPLDGTRTADLRAALAALPEDSWVLEANEIPGRWMVYMGRFADEDALAKKRAELRALKVAFDRPGAALEPGLSLGRFATQEAAQRGQADLASHGIRTSRVVQERAPQTNYLLRLPASTAALRAQLDALHIAWGDMPPQPCK